MAEKRNENPHVARIADYLTRNSAAPLRPRRLARLMGVDELEYPRFRDAFAELRRTGRIGRRAAKGAGTVIGRYHGTQRGFGFVTPQGPEARDDVYIPAGGTGGAITGDLVVVELARPRRGGRGDGHRVTGEIVEILERALEQVVGTLELVDGDWFLEPDGGQLAVPVAVDALPPGTASVAPGTKALVEIVDYPQGPGMLPAGVVLELIGPAGSLEAETRSVILARGLPHVFSEAALEQARRAAAPFATAAPDPAQLGGEERADLTGLTILTIDPEEARDYDDAVSLERRADGVLELGVHIADVSHFVTEGSALDLEARERGTSVYFPRQVVPMLPAELSQGACALAPGVLRLAVSVFIGYDDDGEVRDRRVERSVIASRGRLTYEQAQRICDGDRAEAEKVPAEVAALVRALEWLARTIRDRRRRAGMLSLDLPEVRLVLDGDGRVIDARPEPDLFTHTLIEMFMVEANEAVAELLAARGAPVMRRVHPPPKDEDFDLLRRFARAAGHAFPEDRPGRGGLQRLIEAVRGRPEGLVINLALLRSLQRAHYSVRDEGHFALASEAYCHFTSPIRRYPDLVVHRMVSRVLLGAGVEDPGGEDAEALEALAKHCSQTERRAEAAEQELRQVLVLQHLATRLGAAFEGVITGVASFGLFVQSPRFLVEGLIAQARLGEGRWEIAPDRGAARNGSTGATYRLGDSVEVAIARVDVAQRHLDLELVSSPERAPRGSRASTSGRRGAGAGGRARRSSSSRSR